MGLVVDTSALIDVERALPAEKQVREWANRLDAIANEPVVVPAIVLAEMWAGVALAETPRRQATRRARIEALAAHAPLAEFDAVAAMTWGLLFGELSKLGALIPANHLTVAAIARRLDYGVLVGAAGERHFRKVPNLRIEVLRLETETKR